MPATTHLPPAPPGCSRPRRTRRPNPERVALAGEVLTTLATMTTTPAVAHLVAALNWPAEKLAGVLDAMERAELVERWSDPDRSGTVRVMLSAASLARLGLRIAPRGDRWNPDRPPGGR